MSRFFEFLWFCIAMLVCIVRSDIVVAASLVDTILVIKPSIVGVGTYLPTRRPPAKLIGTGFVTGDGSLIATNWHVVSKDLSTEQLERLVVYTGIGQMAKLHNATVVASSADHDLAILKISANIPPLNLADISLPVQEGESIAFTGFPIGSVLGLYPATHRGIISAITPIAIPSDSSRQLDALKIKRLRESLSVYQLDATAYPGNSGSPVYRADSGEVVGILNKVFVKSTKEDVLSNPSGISYAIPVKHLRALLEGVESAK